MQAIGPNVLLVMRYYSKHSKRNLVVAENIIIHLLIITIFFFLLATRLVCFSFTASRTIPCHRQSSNEEDSRNSLQLSLSIDDDGFDEEVESTDNNDVVGYIHHTAMKTRNITLAIEFYSLLGFEPTAKFKAGPAKAAWMMTKTLPKSRIELIEVPSYLLNEPEGMKRRALDLFKFQEYLGMNHLALDVTNSIQNSNLTNTNVNDTNNNKDKDKDNINNLLLSVWMESLNEKSLKQFQKSLRVALEAEQFMVGNIVYERAFIYDADGSLIELLRKATELPQYIDPLSGWNNYDGQWVS
jgi:catechol 2,3-dioxygenase-like lactoylglutathione lyase family enzyme